jgi:double-stranded uracil-DNA glycosylase
MPQSLSPGRPRPSPTGRLRDQLRPGVQVLFVGINPGLRSAATGHHFAGYSNRFWKLLYESGLVPERITCEDDVRLPEWGYGITNIVPRATAGIGELASHEYRAGARVLLRKIARYRPRVVALVGVTVWRALAETLGLDGARTVPARLGVQDVRIHGARVCVLPNPSGRNATLSYEEMLQAFREVREFVGSLH